MANITSTQKKTLAKDIYCLGSYTFEEIAEKVGTTRQTVSKWAKDGQWDDLKAGMSVSREQILKGLYAQVNEINKAIQDKPQGERYATPAQADTLAKLSASIKKMESDIGISELVSAGMRFSEWMRPVDLDKAKEFVKLWDAFLKDQI